jgi:hypothetical protein
MKTKNALIVIVFFICSVMAAQTADYTKEPGYFNYEKELNIKLGSAITEVYLEEPMLKMIAKMTKDDKEGISTALDALKLVRVNEYQTEKKDSLQLESDFESMNKKLQSMKWSRIIKTRSHGNFANIFVKEGNSGEYLGLLLLSMDKNSKLTFVNIVGKINLETFGKISGQLGIPNADGKK